MILGLMRRIKCCQSQQHSANRGETNSISGGIKLLFIRFSFINITSVKS